MTDYDDIHTCSYYCERPACVRAQRDELRGKYFDLLEEAFEIRKWGSFGERVIDAASKGLMILPADLEEMAMEKGWLLAKENFRGN